MAKETKEIVAQGSAPTMSIEKLIGQAIDKGVPVETMERLLAMRTTLKAEFAKEKFDHAMAAFQNECPVIKKKKNVVFGGSRAYSYAPLEVIVEQVKGLLNIHGFSYAIQTKTEGKEVVAICIAKHTAGYSESSEMRVPLGNKTNAMSDTQVVAAALTFAKRYAFCNAFGILTGDEDTNGPKVEQSDNPRAGFDKAVASLRACKSVDALNKTWRSLTAKQKVDDELIALGKELKRKLS